MEQHCVASVACLLSSIKLLSLQRQQAFQLLVRGVYGLQLYATEYWTEYLLAIIGHNEGLDRDSTLHCLLCQLSSGIGATSQTDGENLKHFGDDPSQNKRLEYLREHQSIYYTVRQALWARSIEQLEQCLKGESCGLRLSPEIPKDINA